MRLLGESITVGPEMGAKMCVGSSRHSGRYKKPLPADSAVHRLPARTGRPHAPNVMSIIHVYAQTDRQTLQSHAIAYLRTNGRNEESE